LRGKLRALASERHRFRVLSIINDVARECLAVIPDTSTQRR